MSMIAASGRIPHGPLEKYSPDHDLLAWICEQFKAFGDIYKASIYGTNAYVVSNPEHSDYVLRKNWRNYKKGQAIKRIGLLLGNGLMVSEGGLWKRQRQMIQPAFHDKATGQLTGIIKTANLALLRKWEQAAEEKGSVNITHDLSLMVLEVVLVSIFGDDYEQVAPHFGILSEESARDLQFAQTFRSLGQTVAQIAARRRSKQAISADILGMLMEARDRENGDVMPERQLVSEIMTLIPSVTT